MRIAKKIHKNQFNVTLHREFAVAASSGSVNDSTTKKNKKRRSGKRCSENSNNNDKSKKIETSAKKNKKKTIFSQGMAPDQENCSSTKNKISIVSTQQQQQLKSQQQEHDHDYNYNYDYDDQIVVDESLSKAYDCYSTRSSLTASTVSSSFSTSFSSSLSPNSSSLSAPPVKKSMKTTTGDNNFIEMLGWGSAHNAMTEFFDKILIENEKICLSLNQ